MCDSLCVLGGSSSDGVTWFAKNSDRPPGEAQRPEWYPAQVRPAPVRATWIEVEPFRSGTLGVLGSRPSWQWGFEHGVNEAGVAVGNEAVYTSTTNPRSFPDALTGLDIVRLALERAPSATAAVDVIRDLLDRYGQGGPCHDDRAEYYWSSFLVVDAGEAYVVDTDAADSAVARVRDRVAITNRLAVPGFADERALRNPVVDACVAPRGEVSDALLARPAVGGADLRDHLRSHTGGDGGWTICMHNDVSTTTASLLVGLGERATGLAEVLLGAPCRSVFVPVAIGHPLGPVPAWERFDALRERPAAFAALEQELRRDAEPTAAWNAEAWRRVDAALSR